MSVLRSFHGHVTATFYFRVTGEQSVELNVIRKLHCLFNSGSQRGKRTFCFQHGGCILNRWDVALDRSNILSLFPRLSIYD